MESLAGQFLVASPSILDPNFQRAVVFITAHSEEGAVGVILNRRSEATVGDAVPQLAPVTDLGDPVFVGGPVNPEGVAGLPQFPHPHEGGGGGGEENRLSPPGGAPPKKGPPPPR